LFEALLQSALDRLGISLQNNLYRMHIPQQDLIWTHSSSGICQTRVVIKVNNVTFQQTHLTQERPCVPAYVQPYEASHLLYALN
jgi:hypothetical protein